MGEFWDLDRWGHLSRADSHEHREANTGIAKQNPPSQGDDILSVGTDYMECPIFSLSSHFRDADTVPGSIAASRLFFD